MAEAISPQKVAKVNLRDVKKFLTALGAEGYELPPTSAATVTVKIATNHCRDGDYQTAVAKLAFWSDQPSTGWDFDSAALHALLPEVLQVQDQSDEASDSRASVVHNDDDDDMGQAITIAHTIMHLRARFLEGFFNDYTLSLIQKATEDSKPIFAFVTAFLKQVPCFEAWAADYDAKLKPLKEAADIVFQTCRGLIAVMDPRPHSFGAVREDVDFVFTVRVNTNRRKVSKETPCLSEVCIPARPMVHVLKTTDGFWAGLLSKYTECLVVDRMKKESFYELENDLLSFVDIDNGSKTPGADDEPVDVEAKRGELLARATTLLPDLRSSLREGACAEIDKLLLGLFSKQWESLRACDGGDVDAKLAALKKSLELIPEAGKDLRAKVDHRLDTLTDASNVTKLDRALTLPFSDFQNAVELRSCLEPFLGQVVTEERLGFIGDCRELLWKLVASLCRSPTSTTSQVTAVSGTLELIAKFEGVRAIDCNKKDKELAVVPGQIGLAIFRMRDGISSLRAVIQSQGDETDLVDKLFRSVEAWKKLAATYSAAGALSGAMATWVNDMIEAGATINEEAKALVASRVLPILEAHKGDFISQAAELEVIAGGHPGGQGRVWSSGLSPNATHEQMIKHAETTMMVAKGGKIATATSKLDNSLTSMRTVFAKYKGFLQMSLDDFCKDDLADATATLKRGKATRFEAAVLRSLTTSKSIESWRQVIDKETGKAGDIISLVNPILMTKVKEVQQHKKK
jgi:hypothetical protein